ncbi:hypothetical protein AAY473_035407 [Plecturocebus cupreus]
MKRKRSRLRNKHILPGAVAHICNPSTLGAKAGGSGGQEFKTSLAKMVTMAFTDHSLCQRSRKNLQHHHLPAAFPTLSSKLQGAKEESPTGKGSREKKHGEPTEMLILLCYKPDEDAKHNRRDQVSSQEERTLFITCIQKASRDEEQKSKIIESFNKVLKGPGAVAHTCNPKVLGGQEVEAGELVEAGESFEPKSSRLHLMPFQKPIAPKSRGYTGPEWTNSSRKRPQSFSSTIQEARKEPSNHIPGGFNDQGGKEVKRAYKKECWPGTVAHTCNPNTLGG